MATFIKGDAIANATSYELLEKSGSDYTSLAQANKINFNLSALELPAGDHTLVVKAKADGFDDSEYSNEVVYTVDEITTWYIDYTDNSFTSLISVTANPAGRGWVMSDTNPAYTTIINKPINTMAFWTEKETQQVTVMKLSSRGASTGTVIATVTATAKNGLAIIKFPEVTLAQGEYLSLFSQDDNDINFKFISAQTAQDNGILDNAFYGRVPIVNPNGGSGSAWNENNGCLTWSYGYTNV